MVATRSQNAGVRLRIAVACAIAIGSSACVNPVYLRKTPDPRVVVFEAPLAMQEAARLVAKRNEADPAATRASLLEAARVLAPLRSRTDVEPAVRAAAKQLGDRIVSDLAALIVKHPQSALEGDVGLPLYLDRREGTWPAVWFRELQPTESLAVFGLSRIYRRDGVGVPLVADATSIRWPQQDAQTPPEGIVYPATAQLWFPPGECAVLSIANPREIGWVRNGGLVEPLAADYSTPYAALLEHADLTSLGRSGLLAPGAGGRSGLFLMEPYDPNKSIVVMVHGLASSPLAWRELTNAIFGRPELRDAYQVWHYFYPTGIPYLYAASRFRRTLDAAIVELDPTGKDRASTDVVLVGHSMGGLLAKTAASNSANGLWDSTFTVPPERLAVDAEDVAALQDIFFFEPKPYATRVIFVMSPHGGSELARGALGRIGSSLVRLPADFTGLMARVAEQDPQHITPTMREILRGGGPTSIRALDPRHPVLRALREVRVAESVPFHNVIGEIGSKSSDGVVAYDSAYLEGAASTHVVRAGHRQIELPAVNDVIAELLIEHARTAPPRAPLGVLESPRCP